MRSPTPILPALLLLFYQPAQAGKQAASPQQKLSPACEALLGSDATALPDDAAELKAGPNIRRALKAALRTNSDLTEKYLSQKRSGRALIDTSLIQEISETRRKDRLAIVATIDEWLLRPSQRRWNGSDYFQIYTRRNLELIRFLLLRPEFSELIRTLKRPVDTDKALGSIDDFLRLYSSLNVPGRGGYPFSVVLESAELIRQAMRTTMGADDYLEIYGSFPNLKASLLTSDIDIHLSESMETKYFESFKVMRGLTGAFQQDRGIKIPLLSRGLRRITGDRFGAALLKAEDDVGALLKRRTKRYGQLLGILVPAIFSEARYSFYNPITVRIQKDRSVVVVRDVVGDETIEIPLDAQGGPR